MVRLIDVDALDRAMYHKSFEVDDGRNIWNSGLWIRYKIYEEASREAPTIEAVPVRHGKWLPYLKEGLRYKCSECGSRFSLAYMYCPHCGAKMDAERGNDETD